MGTKEKSYSHAGPFNYQKDAQADIKAKIQNEGAFIPTGLDMIQNLKKVTNGMNPTSMQSVGAANFAQALQALAGIFSAANQGKQQQANTDPCSIPVDQRTPQQQYDCEQQQAVAQGLIDEANTASVNSTTDEEPVQAPVVDQTANTAAYYQAIADISNTVIVPVGNLISSNTETIAVMADSAADDVVGLIAANSTLNASLANSLIINLSVLLRAPQIKTSGTSYTTPNGCQFIYVECVGGGGTGGTGTTTGAGPFVYGAGGSGGSGAYCAKYFSVSPNTAYSYSVGAAGSATTFTVGATTITAGAGANGSDGTGVVAASGSGGSATNGDLNNAGGDGGVNGSAGGASFFGGGYGAGGAGGVSALSANNVVPGVAGHAGVIRIWEY